ncbi:acyltransferase family protein [Bifidobacterium apri]|uniref:acyltransferase family protein n=1 Tax=Bifidobacterium apri TaxID=1769423 RepID=UPI003992F40C
MTKRIAQLDAIKGIAIILVVLGHCIYVFAKASSWMVALDEFIYIFHMPLFFAVSGYLFNPNVNVAKKARRLLVPFFVWASPVILVHILLGKYSSNFYMNLLEECSVLLRGGYYWYLIYLFYMIILAKICFKLTKSKIWMLIISMLISLASYLIATTCAFPEFLVRYFYNYFFFLAGYLAKSNGIFKAKKGRRYWILGFGILTVVTTEEYFMGVEIYKIFAAIGIVGIVFLLMEKIDFQESNALCRIGTYTMAIYLFDQYLIDVENKFIPDIAWLVPVFAFVNICVPIVIYELIIKNSKILLYSLGE